MAGIVSALAARRGQLLGRESVAERRLAAYELPREMGKLSAPLSRFLIDVCRPMHLGVSPQLRGFYFVGAHFLYAMSSTMIHGVGRDAARIAAVIEKRCERAAAVHVGVRALAV